MTDPTPMNESPIMEEENAISGTNNNEKIAEGGIDNNNNNNIDGNNNNNNTITPQLLHHPTTITTGSVSAPTSPSHTTRVQHHRIPGKHHTTTNTVSPRQPHRPLSTYTNFGSPIHRPTGRLRSVSLGGGGSPHPYTGGAPTHHHPQPTFSVGNPQASGMICMPHLPFGAAPPVSLSAPPEISDQRKAMEAAAAAERTRAKQLEEEEREYTADQLRAELKKERLRASKIQADLAALRSCTVQQQLQAEVLEEGRINGLMRKLDVLQEEKGRIILVLEREEDGKFCKNIYRAGFLSASGYF